MKIKSYWRYFVSSIFLSLLFLISGVKSVFANDGTPFDPNITVGKIKPTQGIERFDQASGGIGLMLFISTIIKFATIIGGVWVLFNFILAGFTYVTSSGDAGAHSKVNDRITMSVIGLILLVATYTIIAIIGFVFFGDAGFILNPQISGPEFSG